MLQHRNIKKVIFEFGSSWMFNIPFWLPFYKVFFPWQRKKLEKTFPLTLPAYHPAYLQNEPSPSIFSLNNIFLSFVNPFWLLFRAVIEFLESKIILFIFILCTYSFFYSPFLFLWGGFNYCTTWLFSSPKEKFWKELTGWLGKGSFNQSKTFSCVTTGAHHRKLTKGKNLETEIKDWIKIQNKM